MSAASTTELITRLTDGGPEPAEVIQRVLDLAVETIAGADGASLTVHGGDGKPYTSAASDEWVLDVDRLQYDKQQGPCLEVAATDTDTDLVWASDPGDLERWPVFGPAAAEAGVRAVLAAGLTGRPDPNDGSQPEGALNVYARREGGFSEADRDQAVLLGAVAGVTIGLSEHRLKVRRLNEALLSRDVIGQAKGVLMERHGVSADEAFSTLRRTSNQLNIKLRDIAERVTGEFGRPARTTRPRAKR